MGRHFSWQGRVPDPIKKIPVFYRTPVFIGALTNITGPSPERDRSSRPPYALISLTFAVTVATSSHLHLGLPMGCFPSSFTTKILYAFLCFLKCVVCPTHLLLELATKILLRFTLDQYSVLDNL